MDKTIPYLDEDGTLVIPFACADHGYKYWKQEGRPLAGILTELGVDEAVWDDYTHVPYPGTAAARGASDAGAPQQMIADNADAEGFGDETDDPEDGLDDEQPLPSEADLAHPARMA
ncbi:hypothetical protein GKC30_01370 [Pseudodesulfovibrio sp. F-1]|uniref:Uncharacterized protein n=1 Tax=Pseudodesulfovibrio alkaliphilus TaxID=2661613 RepID=A0A7K1KJM6_9BACT|nr:hypothetical protein [Pseudodesulfovibrio alkaliphilus]MUM76278.1 hypothetical protein [Pseudodesulfovibrio alkaliphilus]